MHGYLERFAGCKIAVVGDIILDSYLSGDVSRLSPEAPVPIVLCHSERKVPGGAANVAMNIVSIGGAVKLLGVTGHDEASATLLSLLKDAQKIDLTGIVRDPSRQTTQKLRIIGQNQQVVRIDRETHSALSSQVIADLIRRASDAFRESDIIIFSDYGKGVLNDEILRALFAHAHALDKRIILDPKRRDWTAYKGASILTPNRKELSEATGLPCETDEEVITAAGRARSITGGEILVTRSEKGMLFLSDEGQPFRLPTVAQEVFDVSGAGDTVVAVLATAAAAGAPIVDAIKLANHAAGIVVGKFGTATVSTKELEEAILPGSDYADAEDGRCLNWDEAIAIRAVWASQNLTVGFTNGCFDILHPGHIGLINQAAAHCDRLIVALNTDQSVRRLKGSSRPLQNEDDRALVMGAVKGVAAVVLFGEDTPYELIEVLQPDLLVKGADYKEEDVVGAELVKARGGKLLLVHLRHGKSTSNLVNKGARELLRA
jgi:D-beta-D-heptose 7-phosphate kinase / D-beta-D-heptose 1-phosphate adenosyltransferase